MRLTMKQSSRSFLEKHLPEALNADTLGEVLILLYDLIDAEGFAPPTYDEYNEFGVKAQRVYDDIYWSNVSRKEHGDD